MRPASCDDLQSAFDCVDVLRDSVPARRPQELLDAICSIEVLARKTHATMLELVAGLDAAHIAGDQGSGTTWKLLAAMRDLNSGQARAECYLYALRRCRTASMVTVLLTSSIRYKTR